MFEQEMEMERRPPVLPAILMSALLVAVLTAIGGIGWLVFQTKKGIAAAEAAPIVEAALKARGPATIQVSTGLVKPSTEDDPRGPHYRLLERAGVLKLTPDRKTGFVRVVLTPAGQQLVRELAAAPVVKNPDGTETYSLRLAERRLSGVKRVVMQGPKAAAVEYTWEWMPNRLGDLFDASGPAVKAFNTWDRATLIQKYSADFYRGRERSDFVSLVRKDGNWIVAQ